MGNGKGRSGSSPLARGLRCITCVRACVRGIIPARAGFTIVVTLAVRTGRDHPRSRGVYLMRMPAVVRPGGSSPLARGLRLGLWPIPLVMRIIPARAGFTPIAPEFGCQRWDHPRSRGVYTRRSNAPPGLQGSSPLARGLRCPAPHGGAPGGIIPARAGFTHRSAPSSSSSSDHPRSRGVYLCSSQPTRAPLGSSPLARGLLRFDREAPALPRIIPARAGFTLSCRSWSRSSRDHPRSRGVYAPASATTMRSRGVYVMVSVAVMASSGSSPLARGLPAHGRLQ